MGTNSWFEFKQFRIEQKESAMKVGTDGVILGAWTSVDNALRILDVGTGTGLIALMLAQRCRASIDAVEIDEAAYKEAIYNFGQSPWKERLAIHYKDFLIFSERQNELYDVIVCNPPFFIDSLKTNDPKLTLARHNVCMTFEQLISGASRLLKRTGRLSVIIPTDCLDIFRESARLEGFYMKRRTDVIAKQGKPAVRVLLEFSLLPVYPLIEKILIRNEAGDITGAFKQLTLPYYLNF